MHKQFGVREYGAALGIDQAVGVIRMQMRQQNRFDRFARRTGRAQIVRQLTECRHHGAAAGVDQNKFLPMPDQPAIHR
jgi:hypothetical protein